MLLPGRRRSACLGGRRRSACLGAARRALHCSVRAVTKPRASRLLPHLPCAFPQMALAVGGTVVGGTAVPLIAAELQFWKARGGQ